MNKLEKTLIGITLTSILSIVTLSSIGKTKYNIIPAVTVCASVIAGEAYSKHKCRNRVYQ